MKIAREAPFVGCKWADEDGIEFWHYELNGKWKKINTSKYLSNIFKRIAKIEGKYESQYVVEKGHLEQNVEELLKERAILRQETELNKI